MTDYDLSLISDKRNIIKLHGKDITFKVLTVEQHLLAEFDAQELDNFPITSKADIKKLSKKVTEYVNTVMIIDPEDAAKITMDEYKRLRKYMVRLDMYDQGFTDAEIDELEKKAAFRVLKESIE